VFRLNKEFDEQQARFTIAGDISVECIDLLETCCDQALKVMPPLVGAEGVSLTAFLALDTAGSLLWSAFYVGLGYVCANQVAIAIGWAQHFGLALAISIGAPIALYAGWRGLALLRMIRRLQVRRISPSMLHRKLNSKSKVAVLDLLDFEQEADESAEAIPGAFRVDPSILRKSSHVTVPADVEIVLYSSSAGEMVCARAALELNRIGVDNVWVLDGGIKDWREKGFSVSRFPESPEAVAERLRVKLGNNIVANSSPEACGSMIDESLIRESAAF
jgi:rhodanese-related sulfurtransferase